MYTCLQILITCIQFCKQVIQNRIHVDITACVHICLQVYINCMQSKQFCILVNNIRKHRALLCILVNIFVYFYLLNKIKGTLLPLL